MKDTEIINRALNIPVQISLLFLNVYRLIFSPLKNILLGPRFGCRFHPTCSTYAIECLRSHGFIFGSYYILRRILSCNPFHRGGHDPVPEKRN